MFLVPVTDAYLHECKALKNPALFGFYAMAVLMSMTHAPIADPIVQSDVKLRLFKLQTMVKLVTEIEESTSDATDYSMVSRRRSDFHDCCASLKHTMLISGLDLPHSEQQRHCAGHRQGELFIARLCITAQLQMLAFRVWTRPAITPAPVLVVTKTFPAPVAIDNADHTPFNPAMFEETVTYECHSGHSLDGTPDGEQELHDNVWCCGKWIHGSVSHSPAAAR